MIMLFYFALFLTQILDLRFQKTKQQQQKMQSLFSELSNSSIATADSCSISHNF